MAVVFLAFLASSSAAVYLIVTTLTLSQICIAVSVGTVLASSMLLETRWGRYVTCGPKGGLQRQQFVDELWAIDSSGYDCLWPVFRRLP